MRPAASFDRRPSSSSLEREPACAALISTLVGAKCRVPYRTLSGRTLSLNALVHAVELEHGTARVMLLTPPERRAVPCPRFLADVCPLNDNDSAARLRTAISLSSSDSDSEADSDADSVSGTARHDNDDDSDADSKHDVELADMCTFSHGVRVPIESLAPFVSPDFSLVRPATPVLVRSPLPLPLPLPSSVSVAPSQSQSASASASSVGDPHSTTSATGDECAIWLPGRVCAFDELTRDVDVELDESAHALSADRVRRVPLHHVFPLGLLSLTNQTSQ